MKSTKTLFRLLVSGALTASMLLPSSLAVYQAKVKADSLYLRSAPGGSIIATLAQGTTVAVTNNSSEWYKVIVDGKEGYVSGSYLTGTTATDFSVQLNAAQADGADLVFLPIYYQPASLILAQAAAAGYKPEWFGVDGMDGILTMKGFDTSLAEGVMLLTPFNADSTDERTAAFVKKYQDMYGEVPNQFAANAYDCVYAYAQALEAAGATPDMSAADLCTKMIEQFTSMTFDGLTGNGMTWNEQGQVTKSPKGMVIQNGAYVGLD